MCGTMPEVTALSARAGTPDRPVYKAAWARQWSSISDSDTVFNGDDDPALADNLIHEKQYLQHNH